MAAGRACCDQHLVGIRGVSQEPDPYHQSKPAPLLPEFGSPLSGMQPFGRRYACACGKRFSEKSPFVDKYQRYTKEWNQSRSYSFN